MPNFYDLPRELRDAIYEELLIYPSSHISVDVYCGEFLYPAILLANKKTYHEAIALLYSKNQFNFNDSSGTILGRFLAQIGPQNASLLRHIDISFPQHDGVLEFEQGTIALEEDTTRVLDLIKDKCTGIQTLETTPISTDYALREGIIASLVDSDEANEFLWLLFTRFEAMSSLQEVTLNVYDEPVDHVKEKISAFGWHIKITERAEDDFTDGDSDEEEYDEFQQYEEYWEDNDDYGEWDG